MCQIRRKTLRKTRTELRSLEELEFRLRCQHALHSLNVLLLFEARKNVKVVLGLDEGSTRQRDGLSIKFYTFSFPMRESTGSKEPSQFRTASERT